VSCQRTRNDQYALLPCAPCDATHLPPIILFDQRAWTVQACKDGSGVQGRSRRARSIQAVRGRGGEKAACDECSEGGGTYRTSCSGAQTPACSSCTSYMWSQARRLATPGCTGRSSPPAAGLGPAVGQCPVNAAEEERVTRFEGEPCHHARGRTVSPSTKENRATTHEGEPCHQRTRDSDVINIPTSRNANRSRVHPN
jgi:hypothetical protein